MEVRVFYLNLQERPFEAIKNRTKKIEVRANKNETSVNSINKINIGDTIIFTRNGTNEKIQCSVTRIVLYPDVRSLLLAEGTEQTLSSGKNLEDGIKSIESISDYKEQIAKNGVFAIALLYEGNI